MFSYTGEGIPLNIPPPAGTNKLIVQPNNMHAHMGHYMPQETSTGLHGALNMTAAMNPFNNFHAQRSPFPYTGLTTNMLRDAPNMRENPHLMREPSNLSRDTTTTSRDSLISVKDLTTAMNSHSNPNFNMFDDRYRTEEFERLERGRSLLNIPHVNPRLPKSDEKMRQPDQNGTKYHIFEPTLPPYFDVKPDFPPENLHVHSRNYSVYDQHKNFSKTFDNHEKLSKNVAVQDAATRRDVKKFDSTDSDQNFVSKSSDIAVDRLKSENYIKVEQDNTISIKGNGVAIENIAAEVNIHKRLPLEFDTSLLTKQEESWTDKDYMKPFVKDVHGFTKEQYDLSCFTVIEAKLSVSAAIEAIKGLPIQGDRPQLYECLHCALLYRHPKRFLIHFKWHSYGLTNEKRRQALEEKEQRRLARKKVSEKPVTSDDGSLPFVCDSCDRAFSNRQKLITHRNKAHPGAPRACRACEETFPTDEQLRQHTRAAHTQHAETDDAKFMCDECPKTFKYMHSLLRHQPIHAEKKFGCKECDKKFGSELLLNIHAKTHAKVASYRCSYCGKGYYHAYNLSVHERGHRGERPYQCEVCRSTYATNSSLKRHMRVSHNTSKPYECGVCHRSFVTEQIRERHALRQHGGGGALVGHAGPRRRRRRAKPRADVYQDASVAK